MFNHENTQSEIEFLNRKEVQTVLWNSLELNIPPTVYPPRQDTDLLHQVLASITPFGSKRLLEIGSGSGAVSIAAAMRGWTVHACDINPYAVAATQYNAKRAEVEVDASEGGIGPIESAHSIQAWSPGTYDMVVWNMPYIPAEEIQGNVLGPMEEAALVDTHPEGLLSVFARWMANNTLTKITGTALLVCRGHVGHRRSIDVLRQHGLAARIVQSTTFEDNEAIHVVAVWHPFVSSRHHKLREIDSTNAELLRGTYNAGDSLVATVQTSGRGRHGHDWQDHPESFKGSWVVDSKQLLSITPRQQLFVAQEINAALQFKEEHMSLLSTKWPNDLLLRTKDDAMWRKYGGILFQSYSKGDEQRVVLGIGVNVNQDSLNSGQGSIEDVDIHLTASELFPILHAVVASLFEAKHPTIATLPGGEINMDSLLKNCFYRNQMHTVESVSSHDLVLVSEENERQVVTDDVGINWTDLHPQ